MYIYIIYIYTHIYIYVYIYNLYIIYNLYDILGVKSAIYRLVYTD